MRPNPPPKDRYEDFVDSHPFRSSVVVSIFILAVAAFSFAQQASNGAQMQVIARPGTSHRTANPSSTGLQGFALAASNTFEGFFRFPAEVRQFIPMD